MVENKGICTFAYFSDSKYQCISCKCNVIAHILAKSNAVYGVQLRKV